MVKPRDNPNISVEKRVEKFASAADGHQSNWVENDKDAPRAYKAIRVPFNQYEYELLVELCKQTNRSKLNMLRHALIFYADNIVPK